MKQMNTTYIAYRSKLGTGIVRKRINEEPSTLLTYKGDWGNRSHDCLELAVLLLANAYPTPVTDHAARRFMEDVLSRLPYDGWTLEPSEGNRWTTVETRAAS
jgi:hypothetical protein